MSVAISNNRCLSSLPRLLLLPSGRWAALCPGWEAPAAAVLEDPSSLTGARGESARGPSAGTSAVAAWGHVFTRRTGIRFRSLFILLPQWNTASLSCQQLKSYIVFMVLLNWIFSSFLYWGTVALSRRILCARAHQTVYIPAPFLVGTIKNCLWS